MPTVVAFDPGVSPSMAFYAGPDYAPALLTDLGIAHKTVKGQRKEPDWPTIIAALDRYNPTVGAVEKVASRPGEGVVSVQRFADAAGVLKGICLGRKMRLTIVAPATWRKAFKLNPGKESSRQTCLRLFPANVQDFARVKDHNIADALLMAVWLWCQETNTKVPV